MSTPRSFSCRASSIDCSMSQPPSAQSVQEMRTNRGQRSGRSARTARTVSRRNRVRFSNEPPYWSVRWLLSGDRNSWNR